ncbi:MAG: energy transducer TonB [Saprospiraceae bacterium]|jgi:TonB family protein|nr:energy transducer TonB [Saprospiraceae bacterium]
MHKPAKDKNFIKQPWYEGGPKAMKKFVAEQLRYPAEALAEKVEGTVSVRFDIDHKGDVMDAKIIGHGLGHGCDEEAIRLVKSMKFQVDVPRGLRVIHHKTIQIHFKLPNAQAPAQVQLNYVTKEEAPATSEQQPSTGSYSYSISLG